MINLISAIATRVPINTIANSIIRYRAELKPNVANFLSTKNVYLKSMNGISYFKITATYVGYGFV